MSTGLTYVVILDPSVASNPSGTTSFVFSSYDESYNFGDWFCRNINDIYAAPREFIVQVYTTGPNSSGYWNANGTPPYFTAFD